MHNFASGRGRNSRKRRYSDAPVSKAKRPAYCDIQPETPWGALMATAAWEQQKEPFAEAELFQVRGVTFSNNDTGVARQDIIATLRRNEPVMLIKEPDNPVDPAAVKIVSFAGQIGYVPRELTGLFTNSAPVTLGYVNSLGQRMDAPIYGLSVKCIPMLRGAYMDVLPPALADFTDLSACLPPAIWDALEHEQLQKTHHMCQVTGMPESAFDALRPENPGGDQQLYRPVKSVHAHEVWQVLRSKRVVRLEGLLSVATPVHLLRHYLDLDKLRPPCATAEESATEPSASASAAPAAASTSTCSRELGEFAAGLGHDLGFDVARGVARDALLCINAWYVPSSRGPRYEQRWTDDDVQAYAAWTWQERQALANDGEYKLDISWLLEQTVDGQRIQWDDLPVALRKVSLPPPGQPKRQPKVKVERVVKAAAVKVEGDAKAAGQRVAKRVAVKKEALTAVKAEDEGVQALLAHVKQEEEVVGAALEGAEAGVGEAGEAKPKMTRRKARVRVKEEAKASGGKPVEDDPPF